MEGKSVTSPSFISLSLLSFISLCFPFPLSFLLLQIQFAQYRNDEDDDDTRDPKVENELTS